MFEELPSSNIQAVIIHSQAILLAGGRLALYIYLFFSYAFTAITVSDLGRSVL